MRVLLIALTAACTNPPSAPAEPPSEPAATAAAPDDHHAGHAHGADPHSHAAPTADHRFEDAARWAKVFDDPARDAWQRPAELIAALNIAPGSTVADVGAGTGYFAPHLARAVGPDGRVLLLDIEMTLVQHMTERIEREGLTGAQARLSGATAPSLTAAESTSRSSSTSPTTSATAPRGSARCEPA